MKRKFSAELQACRSKTYTSTHILWLHTDYQTWVYDHCRLNPGHISIFDFDIVYYYLCLHADYIPLSATLGSGVTMGGESKVKTYNHIPEWRETARDWIDSSCNSLNYVKEKDRHGWTGGHVYFFDVGKHEIGNVKLKYITSILNQYNDLFVATDNKTKKASIQFFTDTSLVALLCCHNHPL